MPRPLRSDTAGTMYISLYGPTSLEFYHRASGIGNFRIIGPPIRSDGRGIEGITKLPYRFEVGD